MFNGVNKKKNFPFSYMTLFLLVIIPETYGYCRSEPDTARKMIPYTLPWDDMPVDLSFIYKSEKPAGKHGFLQVKGEKFIFEDGTEGRFWGTNFNSARISLLMIRVKR